MRWPTPHPYAVPWHPSSLKWAEGSLPMLLTAGAMGDDNRVPFLSPIQPKSKKAPTRFHAVALSVEAALLCQNFRFLRQLLTMQIVVPPPRQRLCPGKATAKIAKGANSSVAASAGKKPKASGHYKKGERKRKGEWARMLGKARLEGWEEGRKIVQAMKAAPPPPPDVALPDAVPW